MKNNLKKIIEQSGVIPYFIQNNKVKVVLITSKETKQWIIPKGLIEENMSPQESAAKEALEEAGVQGIIDNNLFSEYIYEKHRGRYHVKIYLLEVNHILDKWEEMNMRDRKIVDLFETVKIIKPAQLEVMKSFEKYISERNTET